MNIVKLRELLVAQREALFEANIPFKPPLARFPEAAICSFAVTGQIWLLRGPLLLVRCQSLRAPS